MRKLLDRALALIGLQRVTKRAPPNKDEFATLKEKWLAEYAELNRDGLVLPRDVVFGGTTLDL